jgi:hypothetical protein
VQEKNSLAAGSTNFAACWAACRPAEIAGLDRQHGQHRGEQANFTAVVKNGVAVFDLTGIDTQLFSSAVKRFSSSGLDGATSVIFNTDIQRHPGRRLPRRRRAQLRRQDDLELCNATSLTVNNQFGGHPGHQGGAEQLPEHRRRRVRQFAGPARGDPPEGLHRHIPAVPEPAPTPCCWPAWA